MKLIDLAKRLYSDLRASPAGLLFLTAFISGAYFYPGGGQNEAARYDTIRAVLHEGRFAIDSFVYNSADVIRLGNHYYSSKAPGTFFLGLPFFFGFEVLLKPFPIAPELKWHWICYLTSLFSITLMSSFCAPLMYWCLVRLKAREPDAMLVALVISLGTILYPFSTVFFSHAPTALFAFLGFYQILAYSQEKLEQGSQRWRVWVAGLSLGFSIVLEYPAAIMVVLVGFYALISFYRAARLREARVFILAGILGLAPLFLHNILAFGNPFFIPYEAYAAESNPVFEAHKHGVLGIRVPFLEPGYWPLFLNNLTEITYRPLRGLFFNNPILILILPGFLILFRSLLRSHAGQTTGQSKLLQDAVALSLLATLAYFAFNASYGDSIVYWGGGTSFGPRHLTIMIPFLAIPLWGAIQNRAARIFVVPLACLSTFFCLLATAIEPRAPYAPKQILFDWYLPRFLKGDLAFTQHGIFSNTFVTQDSVAFNWGFLMGLPEAWQLLPLFVLWLWLASRFDRWSGAPRHFYLYTTLAFVIVLGALPWIASP